MWSAAFRAEMCNGSPRRHRVRSLTLGQGASPLALGDEWVISASRGGHGCSIADEGWTSQGGELSAGSWASTLGSWSVPLNGNGYGLMKRLRKGQWVVHEVGFPGWGESRWEPVQLGQAYHFAGEPGRWQLSMRDPVGALKSRLTLDAGGWPLFYSIGTTTTLAAAYTVGDTTLTVTAFSGLDRPTGGTGMVVVNPGSDARFYLTYTGTATSPNRLTGVSAAGVLGTTAVSTANGTTIADAVYIEDDPLSIALKVLTSTGSATNGTYDTLPAGWGFGVHRARIDEQDVDFFRRKVAASSGVDDWVLTTEEKQPEGLGWLATWLGRGGLFFAQRQGQITVRGITNPMGDSAALDPTPITFGRLMGEHIAAESIRWGAWDGGLDEPYYRLKVVSQSSDSGDTHVENATSLPTQETDERDLADTLHSNQTAQRNAIAGRLKPYTLRLCERLECDIVHPLAAGLCQGDQIPLHVRYFGGRAEWQTGAYDGRVGTVVRVDPDHVYGGATKVVLAVPVPAGVG